MHTGGLRQKLVCLGIDNNNNKVYFERLIKLLIKTMISKRVHKIIYDKIVSVSLIFEIFLWVHKMFKNQFLTFLKRKFGVCPEEC